MADNTKTFTGVTPDVWNCVQTTSEKEHGTVYVPPPPSNQGTATTKYKVIIPTYEIILDFDYDGVSTLNYVGTKLTGPASWSDVWNGISETVEGCGGPG